MRHYRYLPFQFYERRLGNYQHVAQLTNPGSSSCRFHWCPERYLHLPLLQMFKKLPYQLMCQYLTHFLLPELLLTHLASHKGQSISQRSEHPLHLLSLRIGDLLHVYEVVTVVGVQHPVCHYLVYFYLFTLLEKVHQIQTLPVKTFVGVHYLHEGEGLLAVLPDFELRLAKLPLHEPLQVVNLVSLTLLHQGIVKKPDNRRLLPISKDKPLRYLLRLKVHNLLELVPIQSQNSALPSLLFLFYDCQRQQLIAGIGLPNTRVKGIELYISFT